MVEYCYLTLTDSAEANTAALTRKGLDGWTALFVHKGAVYMARPVMPEQSTEIPQICGSCDHFASFSGEAMMGEQQISGFCSLCNHSTNSLETCEKWSNDGS